jgi:hypothetical protein
MGTRLIAWMQRQQDSRIRDAAEFFRAEFSPIENIEELFSRIQSLIDCYEDGTADQKVLRTLIANERPYLIEGLRSWFCEIRGSGAPAYCQFATDIVQSGDCIISFNYDVSLDRELHRAGKWEIGDGYGFAIDGLPGESPTKMLKLHGSANWIALLFGGITSGITAVLDGSLGVRPVIAANELSFLGYCRLTDPRFSRPGGSILPWILPTRNKRFFFETSFGREWEDFWDSLWEQARQGLRASEEVLILGYSLAAADERACELLLSSPSPGAKIEIASGSATDSIVGRFKNAGYRNAVGARVTYFEEWVEGMCGRG